MILSQSPTPNRFLLDGNNTIIEIISENGNGHYFRAKIYIDDVLFDEQSWSRDSNNVGRKDLKKLYHAYFQPTFNQEVTTGVVEQTHLIKKVNITVNEHKLSDDSIVDTLDLPEFFAHYSNHPTAFYDITNLQFMDVKPEIMQVPVNAKVCFPFFTDTTDSNIVCKLIDNEETVIYTQTLADVTGKKVHLFNIDLASETIAENILYLTVTITANGTTITKILSLVRLPVNNFKTIAIQNNLGYFLWIHLDGEWEIDNSLDVENYTQIDDTEKTFEINEQTTFKINTGSLLASEKVIISTIVNSLNCLVYYNSLWYEVVTATKKYQEIKDFKHLYEEDLTFIVKRNRDVSNDSFLEAPVIVGFSKTGELNDFITITKAELLAVYTNNLPAAKVRFKNLLFGSLRVITDTIDELVVVNQVYDLENLVSFIFKPIFNASGTPYGLFEFQMSNSYQWSNLEYITINVNDGEPGNYPPDVVLNPLYNIYRSIGTLVIEPIIFDFEDDTLTYLWEIVGSTTGVTLSNETTDAVTITIVPGSTATFQLKLTVYDGTNTVIKYTVVSTYDGFLGLIPVDFTQDGDIANYDTDVIDGEALEIITFEARLTSLQAGQYAIVNFGDIDLEVALDVFNPVQSFTLEYPSSGNLAIPVATYKNGLDGDVTLRLTMTAATRTEINPENNSIDLAPWPSSE